MLVAGEVKDGVAENHIGEGVGKGHLLDGSDLEILRGQTSLERCGELADMVDGLSVLVDGEDFAAFAKQMDEVAAVATSGVENDHARNDVAAQDLIEDVDVDLAELILYG
jgi:hypothetical protein